MDVALHSGQVEISADVYFTRCLQLTTATEAAQLWKMIDPHSDFHWHLS